MKLTIDPEFKSYIPPLSESEREALRASLIASKGAREPIVAWRGVIVDGHNRYELCTEHGLTFGIRELDLPDRQAALAWMFENQIARRNLSVDQIVMLAAVRGVATKSGTEIMRERAAFVVEKAPERAAAVIAGRYTVALAWGALQPRKPRPPRGPSGEHAHAPAPNVAEGLELKGQSTLINAEGELKGRWDKSGAVTAETTPVPPDFALRKVSQFTNATGMIAEWRQYSPAAADAFESAREAVRAHVAEYVRPTDALPAPERTDADLLVAYPLGDPHIGMLAWYKEVGASFDLKIAEDELVQCFRMLVQRAPAADRAIVCNLGDFWHAQDDNQRTPRGGNKLDVDGRAGKVGRVGLRIMRTIVDEALTKHRHVTIRNVPGNHDPSSAFWLPEVMSATYANEPRVTVEDAFNPYQFDAFGRVLLGWCHGDGAKLEALGEIMATDVEPSVWAGSTHRYWNTGHVHHWSQKELRGVFVDTHRTLASRDAWHHHAGYRSRQALKANVYHREWGLDGVAVQGVERVRDAIARAA